jgi:hypothetical protein
MYDETMTYDARRLGTRFDVPFFLFQGESDVITLTTLATEYFAEVEAPSKGLALIKDAGHFAAFTQPDRFLTELLTRVRPLASDRVFIGLGVPAYVTQRSKPERASAQHRTRVALRRRHRSKVERLRPASSAQPFVCRIERPCPLQPPRTAPTGNPEHRSRSGLPRFSRTNGAAPAGGGAHQPRSLAAIEHAIGNAEHVVGIEFLLHRFDDLDVGL